MEYILYLITHVKHLLHASRIKKFIFKTEVEYVTCTICFTHLWVVLKLCSLHIITHFLSLRSNILYYYQLGRKVKTTGGIYFEPNFRDKIRYHPLFTTNEEDY